MRLSRAGSVGLVGAENFGRGALTRACDRRSCAQVTPRHLRRSSVVVFHARRVARPWPSCQRTAFSWRARELETVRQPARSAPRRVYLDLHGGGHHECPCERSEFRPVRVRGCRNVFMQWTAKSSGSRILACRFPSNYTQNVRLLHRELRSAATQPGGWVLDGRVPDVSMRFLKRECIMVMRPRFPFDSALSP